MRIQFEVLLTYSVMTARKGWLEETDVINSMSADALAQQLAPSEATVLE